MQNKTKYFGLWIAFAMTLLVVSCARMGNPDGGWYDETPPRVVGSMPVDKAVNVNTKKISIFFDEFIRIDNPQEKVVVSPPQLEMPEIKSNGKRILVTLLDSLQENTTYTIDFSDAISDNNENNPMGNYTYSFSTGAEIDTFEVSGYVLEAPNLEPLKGVLVGLYDNLADSAFQKFPMKRVSRTDSRGHFVIKGVAPGSYRVYALEDMDGDYRYTQMSERLAFLSDTISPSAKADIRQDTLWRDSLHIESVTRVGYTHFLPDDIVLRAFSVPLTSRYLIKTDRKDPDRFSLFFSYGDDRLPGIRGLNFNEQDAFIIEASEKNDTVTYWLRDTMLVNQDTLRLELTYRMTDTLGVLQQQVDTLDILSKQPYIKRMKQKQKEYEEWAKIQEKNRKRGFPYDTIMPRKPLSMRLNVSSSHDPDRNILISAPTPLASIDTTRMHLYVKHDSLWYESRFMLRDLGHRDYLFMGEWQPGVEYSFELDSAAFVDIYGFASSKQKRGIKVKSYDSYSSLLVGIHGLEGKQLIVQMLNSSDKVYKELTTTTDVAEFYYVTPGTYYLRLFVDENRNGVWDTGDFEQGLQPEPVYYYHEEIECRAKWDVSREWSPLQRKLNQQKPTKITHQKADKERTARKGRNEARAKMMGIPYIPPQQY